MPPGGLSDMPEIGFFWGGLYCCKSKGLFVKIKGRKENDMKGLKIVVLMVSVLSINCVGMQAEFAAIERFDTPSFCSFEAIRNGMAISVTYDKTTGLYFGSETGDERMRLFTDARCNMHIID